MRTVVLRSVMAMLLLLSVPVAAWTGGVLAKQPPPPLPEYMQSSIDPETGFKFFRITKLGKMSNEIYCASPGCGHRYSSAQAWNADQSLLLLASSCGGYCFFDGKSYQPLFHRSQDDDCEWMPQDSESMICVARNSIYIWHPRPDQREIVFSGDKYSDMRLGPGKGNPSRTGHRVAVRAKFGNQGAVVFVFDINTRSKFPDFRLADLPGMNNSCTIAPLGEKIVCTQKLEDGVLATFVLSKEGEVLGRWLENHRPGHGDLTLGQDGVEYSVGISKSSPDKYKVIKRSLEDGSVTVLTEYGEATHVSLRATDSFHWAIVSYEGDPVNVSEHPKWAQHARQVVAIALDGSGKVRVIANTQNIKVDYESEMQATASPDGTQIIWSSNWGKPGGHVYEFVTEVEWPGGI
jgi:hypothetical protein